MIDTRRDELLSLAQAAAQCPAVDGKSPHPSTVWRWARVGLDGVYLEHVRVGRRVVTTRQALEEFFKASAEAWTNYERRAIQLAKLGTADPQIEQFRWLLEELRISLFAQELKTPVPVSVKRLQKQWEGIQHG